MSRSRNFHLPLPDDLYTRLHAQADRTGRPATALAREALTSWLRDQQRREVFEAIASYASAVAGTLDDLDPVLEEASLEHLAAKPRRGRRAKDRK